MKTYCALLLLTFFWMFGQSSPIPSCNQHRPEENIRFYELNITREILNPDCSTYHGPKLVVNSQLPGPPIKLIAGERVRVLVRNLLPKHSEGAISDKNRHTIDNNVTATSSDSQFFQDSAMGGSSNDISIHFHGIRQNGSVDADGVPFLTQKPIPPGGELLQEFQVIGQSGTYFYHAHVGTSVETVFGPLIVYESKDAEPPQQHADNNKRKKKTAKLTAGPYTYDEDRILMISEYWHRTQQEFEDYILGPNFAGIPEADSILINGRTIFNISDIYKSEMCPGYPVIQVEPGKTYRLRVIGATAFRTVGLAIAHHKLTVIEVDGELVEPYKVDYLEVTAGQRFSVLLEANQQQQQEEATGKKDFTISTIRMWAEGVNPASNGFAVLRYTCSNDAKNLISPPSSHELVLTPNNTFNGFPQQDIIQWQWLHMKPVHHSPILDAKPDRTVILRVTEGNLDNGGNRWFINGISFMDPKQVILEQILRQERKAPIEITATSSGYDPYLGTYPLKYNEVVDFVLQSTHLPKTPCRSHPWHMHGHTFYEIAYGPGDYDEKRDGNLRNVPNPIGRDVTLVYPILDPALERNNATANTQVGCGWSKIRIIAVSLPFFVFSETVWC